MLYYKNLSTLFFDSFPQTANRFLALSGYVGPAMIKDLQQLPFSSSIIFGLYKENQKALLHQQLISINSEKTKIYYPDILCHSKCYLWLKDEKPLRGLIGSANFSANGLFNDYRETLFEIDQNQLYPLKGYIELIFNSSKECSEYKFEEILKRDRAQIEPTDLINCEMVLYDPDTGQTQESAGLNWGMHTGKVHTRLNDAYIAIRTEHIRKFPKLFPPKQPLIEGSKRQNEVIEIIWDDGSRMKGLLEGTQPVESIIYPKQISSHPHKDELGIYIRERIGVAEGSKVRREDLIRYGRDTIEVSLLEEGVYKFDFSVSASSQTTSVLVGKIIKDPNMLAAYRKKTGVSIMELAQLAKIPESRLALFETGKEPLSLEQIEIIVHTINSRRKM